MAQPVSVLQGDGTEVTARGHQGTWWLHGRYLAAQVEEVPDLTLKPGQGGRPALS